MNLLTLFSWMVVTTTMMLFDECVNYSKIIKPGGVLSGHDYNIFEGVNKAVDEFSARIGKPVQLLHGNIWYINL